MPRIRTLAPLALVLPLALPLGGCYRYDMRATNTSSQDVRISLVKGKRHREISTVVLEPGSSVSWEGQTQRPLLLRVTNDPNVGARTEVVVPKKVHTEFEVGVEGSEIVVHSDQPLEVREPEAASTAEPESQTDYGDDSGDSGAPEVDLVDD